MVAQTMGVKGCLGPHVEVAFNTPSEQPHGGKRLPRPSPKLKACLGPHVEAALNTPDMGVADADARLTTDQ